MLDLDTLERLAKLHERGALTDQEFTLAKHKVLSGNAKAEPEGAPSRGSWKLPTAIAAVVLATICGGLAIGYGAIGDAAHPTQAARRPPAKGTFLAANTLANTSTANAAPWAPPPPAPSPPQDTANLPPLTGYAGHFAGDVIGHSDFLADPRVRDQISRIVPDEEIRDMLLSGDVVGGRIALYKGSLKWAGCEPHRCDVHNWYIVVSTAGGRASACYYDASTDPDQVTWFFGGRPVTSEQRSCPDLAHGAA